MKKLMICVAASAALVIFAPSVRQASEGQAMAPDAAMKLLVAGNARFVAEQPIPPNATMARVKETSKDGQHPFAAVLGCADSRVPAEILFDTGLGDLFTVRVAGNVSDTDEIGSLEYAVEHLGVSVILVLGHTKCGAVTAVVQHAEVSGSIPGLVDNIVPAVSAAAHDNPKLRGDDLIPKAIRANVWQSIEDILKRSEIIREYVREGHVILVGGLYDVSTGAVEFMGNHVYQDAFTGKSTGAKKHGH